MHLVERFALSAGVEIGKPYIYPEFFPLAVERYITLHTTTKPIKTYEYWPEVVELLKPVLDTHGITILQLGDKDNTPVKGCYSTCGQTTINQLAYILRDSLLHVGADSFPVHVASGMWPEKKIVSLYSNNYPGCVGPYWTKDENKTLLIPDDIREGKRKPNFAFNEVPKQINTIKPETIAKAVCDQLGIEFPFSHKTIHIGGKIRETHLEVVPNALLNIQGEIPIVVRMDKCFNEKVLSHMLGRYRCYIITNRPINKDLLTKMKRNVAVIQYLIEPSNEPSFVEFMVRASIPYALISFLEEDSLNRIKMDYIDLGVIERREIKRLEGDASKMRYRSSKVVGKDGKKYYSHPGLAQGREIKTDLEFHPVVDTDEFWKDLEYYHIINETML